MAQQDDAHSAMTKTTRPDTVELDLGRGLLTLLTRNDKKFHRWAEQVNLSEIVAELRKGVNQDAGS